MNAKEILYECVGLIMAVLFVIGWLGCWYIAITTFDKKKK